MKLTLLIYLVITSLLPPIALGQVEGMWLPNLVYMHMKDPKGIRSIVEVEKNQIRFTYEGILMVTINLTMRSQCVIVKLSV